MACLPSPTPGALALGLLALLGAGLPAPAQAEEEVRIAIVAGKTSVQVEATKLAIYDGDSGERVAWSPEGAAELRVGAKGVELAGPTLRFDGPRGVARLMIEGEPGVRVDGKLYLGRIQVARDGGKLIVINRLPIETYLLGIVGSEMSPEWPMEALKSQAVAARTYAMQRRMMMRAADRPYDLEATVLSQVYEGAERIRPSVVAAVVATHGEVLTYKHRLAEALFHSTCGGKTVAAREAFGNTVPYLVPRACPWCKESARYRWSITLTLDKLTKALRAAKLIGARQTVDALSRAEGSQTVVVTTGKKKEKLSAKKVRAAVGYTVISSERFTTSTQGKAVTFEGMGFGHGVGMCQFGAKGLADRGMSHREILEHYYAGARVKRAY